MGRILETLRKTRPHGNDSAAPPPPRPYRGESDREATPELEESLPYIEVGGRDTPVEASPEVLATAAAERKLDPPVVLARIPQPAAPPAGGIVTFRPLPPQPAVVKPVRERFAPELVALHAPGQAT